MVTNCYATGNVSGSDYVGGVVGQNTNSVPSYFGKVENCVALNPNLSSTSGFYTNFGRVAGESTLPNTLANNYVRSTLTINDTLFPFYDPTDMNGADIAPPGYENTPNFWSGTMGWNIGLTDPWQMGSNGLPELRDMP